MKSLFKTVGFLVTVSLAVFALEPASLKVQSENIQKLNPKIKVNSNYVKTLPNIDIDSIHIGTNTSGKWFYGFNLYNKSSNIHLSKSDVKVVVREYFPNTQMQQPTPTEGLISRNVSANNKILVRNEFRHARSANKIQIDIFDKKGKLLISKEKALSSYSKKINFINSKIVNNQFKYCIKNDSSFTLSSKVNVMMQDLEGTLIKRFDTADFILKRNNYKCAVIDLGIDMSKNRRFFAYAYDNNAAGIIHYTEIASFHLTIK